MAQIVEVRFKGNRRAYFTSDLDEVEVNDYVIVEADRGEDLADLHLSALLSGVYMAPRGLMCISTPMDEAVVDEVVERMTEAVGRLAG